MNDFEDWEIEYQMFCQECGNLRDVCDCITDYEDDC